MKAVILSAGVGKRMRPLSNTRPKVLLPIGGKPFLDYVISSLEGADIEDITLVVGYRKEDIKERYGDGGDFGVDISYVEQTEQKGTAHAISFTDSEEEFAVVNGDIYCEPSSLLDTINRHQEKNAADTIGVHKVKDASSYGVIRVEDGEVKDLIEKPDEPSNQLINAGLYVFGPEIYEAIKDTHLSERGEKEITTSLELLIEEDKVVCANELDSWTHVGKPWDLLAANKYALKNQVSKVNGKIESGAHLDDNVTVEEGALVRSGAYIEGPTYIGKNSDIGPNCYIRPYTSVGENVRIGNAVEVKNSIIMEGTHAAHHAYIGDSIVGSNCNFGAGTKVGNLRLDDKNVMMNIKGEPIDTGRRKLGAVLGDNVQTGINSMIDPGVKAGPNSAIGPGAILNEDLSPNRCVLVEQKERRMNWGDE